MWLDWTDSQDDSRYWVSERNSHAKYLGRFGLTCSLESTAVSLKPHEPPPPLQPTTSTTSSPETPNPMVPNHHTSAVPQPAAQSGPVTASPFPTKTSSSAETTSGKRRRGRRIPKSKRSEHGVKPISTLRIMSLRRYRWSRGGIPQRRMMMSLRRGFRNEGGVCTPLREP